MSKIAYPTWADMGVPGILVQTIRTMPPCFLLDSLVYQLVFHHPKRLQITYSCEVCGYKYIPTKITEEVAQCINCGGKRVFSTQDYIFPKDKVPTYSRNALYNILDIIHVMEDNHQKRWDTEESGAFDWDWINNHYHVRFYGGEVAIDMHPRQALLKAAVLVPYLWDSLYDWGNNIERDPMDQKFMSHLIQHWTSKCWRKQ